MGRERARRHRKELLGPADGEAVDEVCHPHGSRAHDSTRDRRPSATSLIRDGSRANATAMYVTDPIATLMKNRAGEPKPGSACRSATIATAIAAPARIADRVERANNHSEIP